MPFPKKLVDSLNIFLSKYSQKQLIESQLLLMESYKTGNWKLGPLEKLCYVACRMPATYAVMQHVLAPLCISSLLDIGAGPGTSSWVLDPQIKLTCVEHDADFIRLAHDLGAHGTWEHKKAQDYIPQDLVDTVLFSYSLGEMRSFSLAPFWNICTQHLVVIEPGTPQGWQTILQARDELLHLGGYVWAPCGHSKACPLSPPDWCHFGIKLERSELHRHLKQASLNFEEEKFIYLIMGKHPKETASRILRAPQKRTGHVHLKLCSSQGLELITIGKKHKELYRLARDASWGDIFPYEQQP